MERYSVLMNWKILLLNVQYAQSDLQESTLHSVQSYQNPKDIFQETENTFLKLVVPYYQNRFQWFPQTWNILLLILKTR